MSVNFSDDSSDDSTTCFGSESGGSEKSISKLHIDDLESSVTGTIVTSTALSDETSFFTPIIAKKKVRRTNAQIQSDTAAKTAEKLTRSNVTESQPKITSKVKSVKSKSAPVITSAVESTIVIGDLTFPLQTARSVWSTTEQMDLIKSYKSWENDSKKSQNKKLIPISKLWLVHIPCLMGKNFGRVRATPNNVLASSPYQSKWLAIRKKVSDYKAAQVDGREEELPDIEGPTGGGVTESGVPDDRMVAAAAAESARDTKRNTRYAAGVDEESLKIIQNFMDTFPQSVSGIGLMSESDLNSGAGSKRNFCEIEGLQDTVIKEDSVAGPPAVKVSKSSLIIDLTRTAVLHHEENMAFNSTNFEYQKQSRLDDITRREERDRREIEYRDRRDAIDHQRYNAEQERLAEQRRDNLNVQTTFAGILSNLLSKV